MTPPPLIDRTPLLPPPPSTDEGAAVDPALERHRFRMMVGLAEAIRETGEIRLPTGDTPLAWVGIGDVVDVAVTALLGEDLGGVDLSGSEPLSVAELAAEITRVSGREVVHDAPSLDEYRADLEAFDSTLGKSGVDAPEKPTLDECAA